MYFFFFKKKKNGSKKNSDPSCTTALRATSDCGFFFKKKIQKRRRRRGGGGGRLPVCAAVAAVASLGHMGACHPLAILPVRGVDEGEGLQAPHGLLDQPEEQHRHPDHTSA
jgi:hypothetical protein